MLLNLTDKIKVLPSQHFQFGPWATKVHQQPVDILTAMPSVATSSVENMTNLVTPNHRRCISAPGNNFFLTNSTTTQNNSIVKSIRSISQKSKFYRRAVSKLLYTVRNQCDKFYSLYQEYELKILHVGVKLAYLCIYFTETMQGGNLRHLRYCWDCNISVVFPTLGLNAAKIIDYIEKCFKWKLCGIKFPAKNSVEAGLYLPQEWN